MSKLWLPETQLWKPELSGSGLCDMTAISDMGAYWAAAAAPAAGFTLAASGTFATATFSGTINFSSFTGSLSSYSTATNDCIVVAWALADATTATFSGAGATWSNHQQHFASGAPWQGVAIGSGCTSGNTSISVSGGFGDSNPAYVIAVFKGVSTSSPVTATANNAQGTGTNNVTSSSLSYSGGQLLVCAGSVKGSAPTFTSNVWPNSLSNTHIGDVFASGTFMSSLDYATPAATGSGTDTTSYGGTLTGFAANFLAAISHS